MKFSAQQISQVRRRCLIGLTGLLSLSAAPTAARTKNEDANLSKIDSYAQEGQTPIANLPPAASLNTIMIVTSIDAAKAIRGDSIDHVSVLRYDAKAPVSPALYIRVSTEPRHPGKFQDLSGRWWELSERVVTPQMFGAVADGRHDDTAACIAAHQCLSLKNGLFDRVLYPVGNYCISETLPLPNRSAWQIQGERGATIEMLQSNKPIFHLQADTYLNNWVIDGISFTYRRAQDRSRTGSICILLDAVRDNPDGVFGFSIRNVIFDNAYRGISTSENLARLARRFPVWGCTFENVTSFNGMSGATIYLESYRSGMPRINLLNFYAQSEGASEPVITIKSASSIYGDNLEFNRGKNEQYYLEAANSVLEIVRFEKIRLTGDSHTLASYGMGEHTLRQAEVQNIQYTGRSNASIINIFSGNLTVGSVICRETSTVGTGDFLIFSSNGSGTIYLDGRIARLGSNSMRICTINNRTKVDFGRERLLSFGGIAEVNRARLDLQATSPQRHMKTSLNITRVELYTETDAGSFDADILLKTNSKMILQVPIGTMERRGPNCFMQYVEPMEEQYTIHLDDELSCSVVSRTAVLGKFSVNVATVPFQ